MIVGVDSTAYAVHKEVVAEDLQRGNLNGEFFNRAFFAHRLNCFYFIATMTENFWQE